MKTLQHFIFSICKFKLLIFLSVFCFSRAFAQNTLPPSGNVGIGTTTPNTNLDVVGNTNLGGNVTIDSSVTVRDSATFQKKLTVDQDLKIKGTSVFVDNANFKSDLKVLGTVKMKDKLVVDGLTRMNGDANVFGNFIIKSLADSTFLVDRLLSINPNGKLVLSNLTIPQDDTYVCSYVTPWIYANGTTTDDNIALCPNFKSVTIAGDLTIGGITRLNSTGIGVAANNDTQLNIRSVGKEVSMRLFTIPTTTTKYAFQNRVTTPNIIAYSVTNHNTNQDVFVVKGDGSVGIGTDKTTGFMLSVEGDVRTRSIQVDASTLIWSDFVFSNEYKLNDLLEVENFIKTNKHLPDVPSEKEIKEKGINLAKMDAILLQKIEELTLYIIQQEKRIKELEQQVKK
jgi:predicted acyltransferase (DUF342 family)